MSFFRTAKFGVHLPNSGGGAVSPDSLAEFKTIERIAREAEKLQFDTIWANEHATLPTDETRPETKFYEPITLLSNLAARTSKITLGTAIVILPFRDPFVLSREIGTLAELTGERFILGVGPGRFEREYRVQSKNWTDRNKIMIEQIRLLRLLSTGKPVTFTGTHYSCKDFLVNPVPKHLPIVLGGSGELAIQRATRHCDGIMPGHVTPEQTKGISLAISAGLKIRGRSARDFIFYNEIILSIDRDPEKAKTKFFQSTCVKKVPYATDIFSKALVGDPVAVSKKIDEYVNCGVKEFVLIFADENETDFLESMKILSSEVLKRT